MIILRVQQWQGLLQLFSKLRGLNGQDTRTFYDQEMKVRICAWFMRKRQNNHSKTILRKAI